MTSSSSYDIIRWQYAIVSVLEEHVKRKTEMWSPSHISQHWSVLFTIIQLWPLGLLCNSYFINIHVPVRRGTPYLCVVSKNNELPCLHILLGVYMGIGHRPRLVTVPLGLYLKPWEMERSNQSRNCMIKNCTSKFFLLQTP